MPKFYLRSSQTQTLIDSSDYAVQADTLDDAIELLDRLQESAQECLFEVGDVTDSRVARLAPGLIRPVEVDNVIRVLTPNDVEDSDRVIFQVDESGNRLPPGPPKKKFRVQMERIATHYIEIEAIDINDAARQADNLQIPDQEPFSTLDSFVEVEAVAEQENV